jgi:hypothetical protein
VLFLGFDLDVDVDLIPFWARRVAEGQHDGAGFFGYFLYPYKESHSPMKGEKLISIQKNE